MVHKFCGFTQPRGWRRENPRYNCKLSDEAVFSFDTGISPRLFCEC